MPTHHPTYIYSSNYNKRNDAMSQPETKGEILIENQRERDTLKEHTRKREEKERETD